MSYFIVENEGQSYDSRQVGLRIKDIKIMPPQWRHDTVDIEGMDGVLDFDSTLAPRPITVTFVFYADSMDRFAHARDDVFQLFNSRKPFVFIDSRKIGVRWVVKVVSFDYERFYTKGDCTLELIALRGVGESVNVFKEVYTTDDFNHENLGNVPLNPRTDEIELLFEGASNGLVIFNFTTMEYFKYNKTTIASDKLLLKNMRVTKNNLSVLGDTNKVFPNFARGSNNIVVSGATGPFKLTIKNRVYFL